MTVLNRLEDIVGLGLTRVVCDVPFSSSLDGWRIEGDAFPGYPNTDYGYADVRFQTSPGDAYFTHDPYRISGGVDYRLSCKVQGFASNLDMIPFSLIFDSGGTITDQITSINQYAFILFEKVFTTPKSARTLTLRFGPNAPNFMMQNLLIEAVE